MTFQRGYYEKNEASAPTVGRFSILRSNDIFLYYTIMHFSASNKSQKITQYSVLAQSQKSAITSVIIVASSDFTLLRVLALYRYSHIYYRLAQKKKPSRHVSPRKKKNRPRKILKKRRLEKNQIGQIFRLFVTCFSHK